MGCQEKKQGIKFQICGSPVHTKPMPKIKKLFEKVLRWWKKSSIFAPDENAAAPKPSTKKFKILYIFRITSKGVRPGSESCKASVTPRHHMLQNPWVWWNFLRKKPIGRHRLTLRICVCLFTYMVFATTTASFGKYLMTIFHLPPTSPEILGDLGEIPNLKIHSATSPNFASSRATSSSQSWRNFSRSATCIWKVDTHHQAKRTRRS